MQPNWIGGIGGDAGSRGAHTDEPPIPNRSYLSFLGVASVLAAAMGLLYLCWAMTPALWGSGLPLFVPLGFYSLCGMLIGLLAVLGWQLLQEPLRAAPRDRRA